MGLEVDLAASGWSFSRLLIGSIDAAAAAAAAASLNKQ